MMTTERQERAPVKVIEARRWKLQDIDFVPLKHNLLARTAVYCNRRQRLTDSPIPLTVHLLLLALHRESITFARGQRVYKNRNFLAAGALE
jgi:hypothetical protein